MLQRTVACITIWASYSLRRRRRARPQTATPSPPAIRDRTQIRRHDRERQGYMLHTVPGVELLAWTSCRLFTFTVTDCDRGNELTAGDLTKDGVCTPCEGNTFQDKDDTTDSCRTHTVTSCDKGFGLSTQPSASTDGACTACNTGTTQPNNSSTSGCLLVRCVTAQQQVAQKPRLRRHRHSMQLRPRYTKR